MPDDKPSADADAAAGADLSDSPPPSLQTGVQRALGRGELEKVLPSITRARQDPLCR